MRRVAMIAGFITAPVYGEYSPADLNYLGLKAMFVFPAGKK